MGVVSLPQESYSTYLPTKLLIQIEMYNFSENKEFPFLKIEKKNIHPLLSYRE